jgi:adenylate cyclase
VTARVLLPVLSPLVFGWLYYAAAALNEYITERKARQRTVDQFSRFLDPQVVQQVITDDSDSIKTHNTEITVLFSDIRSFTTLSEGRSPQLIFAILNRYFGNQVNVIFRHGGTMDKFIGDAIMAFWGAPLADPEHAKHAVEAALGMSDEIPRFRKALAMIAELAEQGERDKLGELADITTLEELAGLKEVASTFEIGIGIHSGQATVGMLGFEGRMDYTCIGDAVNTASRTEGQTKGKARILVTAETRAQCEDSFDFIDHGVYKVKGREQEVHLYEPTRKATS